MNDVNGLWLHVKFNPFQNFDAFHCMEEDKKVCDFCPHCGIDERLEIQGHFSRSSIWFVRCWSWSIPSHRDHDSAKYVWYDEFRLHQHYKGGYEICKDWEDLDKYGL